MAGELTIQADGIWVVDYRNLSSEPGVVPGVTTSGSSANGSFTITLAGSSIVGDCNFDSLSGAAGGDLTLFLTGGIPSGVTVTATSRYLFNSNMNGNLAGTLNVGNLRSAPVDTECLEGCDDPDTRNRYCRALVIGGDLADSLGEDPRAEFWADVAAALEE